MVFVALMILLTTNDVTFAVSGPFLIGLGNGSIFPTMTHLTPILYKKETSQFIIGIEMAFSNLSIMLTPALFGVISNQSGIDAFPFFLIIMFLLLLICTVGLQTGHVRKYRIRKVETQE